LILNWRSQEIVLAQSIADNMTTSGGNVMVWGVKQDPRSLVNWLKDQNDMFYISHPITQYRTSYNDKKRADGSKEWPEMVHAIKRDDLFGLGNLSEYNNGDFSVFEFTINGQMSN